MRARASYSEHVRPAPSKNAGEGWTASFGLDHVMGLLRSSFGLSGYGLRYRTNPARKISGLVNWGRHYNYYREGQLDSLSFNASLNLTEQISVSPSYTINKASFPQGDFTDHIVRTRINYNFNNQWLTSTFIQYNNTDSFFGVNFRLNYIFRPGDDLFLVYNEGRQAVFDDEGHRVAGLLDGRRDRSLQLKLTYSFDY